MQNATRDRKLKKRTFRQLWNARINAAAHLNGTTYSKLINALKTANITLDRKVLAELAVNEPDAFTAVVKAAQK
jgi:large subunit ribosomal protein L20